MAVIKLELSWSLEFFLRRSKRILADCKLILDVSEVICETRLGVSTTKLRSEKRFLRSLIGINNHSTNCFLVSSRNKITRPNEKISEFLSFCSKHSGLAKIGVPPLESELAIPKSVKTISICSKSVEQFLNLTKKFCGFMSLCV